LHSHPKDYVFSRVVLIKIFKNLAEALDKAKASKDKHIMEFDELVPGARVRYTIIDGKQYLSVRDLIGVVCQKNQNRSAEVWRNLVNEDKTELSEVTEKVVHFKFPGRGQQIQPLITFDGALTLMNWLPGENAKKWRGKTIQILKRYFAGDPSLLDDIRANAASNAPLNQAARASLQADAADETSIEPLNKKQKMYVPTAEELERCERFKDYVVTMIEHEKSFKKFLDFRKEDAQIDVDKNEKLSQISIREKTILDRLETKRQKNDIKYKKALKDIENTPAPAPVQAPVPAMAPETAILTAVLDPNSTTTVLKVYNTNKSAFHLIKNDQKKNFLIKAGHYAAAGYVLRYGVPPQKIIENGHEVNVFPYEDHDQIMQDLFSAYRDMTIGSSQATIDSMFRRQAIVT